MLSGLPPALGCINCYGVGTSAVPIFTVSETKARRGEAPRLRDATSEEWRWAWTRNSPGMGEGCSHALRAIWGFPACEEGLPLSPGESNFTCPSHPHAQPHLALDVEDEDSRGRHGGGQRTREAGREGRRRRWCRFLLPAEAPMHR